MKRLILIIAIVIGSNYSADAQSLFDMFKSFFGVSSKSEEVTTETPKFTTRAELLGKWVFSKGVISYSGSDPIAQMAISALQGQIDPYLAKAGIIPGKDNMTLCNDNRAVANIKDKDIEGRYSYDETTGKITVSLTIEEHSGSLVGDVTMEGGALKILFKAKDALEALKRTSKSIAEDENVKIAEQIISSYPEVEFGGVFRR